jgi:hypothetical protein
MFGQRRTAWKSEEIEMLKRMASEGKSKDTMAVRLRRSVQGVEREAAKHGIELRPRKRPVSEAELDRQR